MSAGQIEPICRRQEDSIDHIALSNYKYYTHQPPPLTCIMLALSVSLLDYYSSRHVI